MLQCFISHCSDDLDPVVRPLDRLLSEHFSKEKYSFFCSSTSSNPLLPGTEVGTELKKKLQESQCMIAVVTDNYLRSPISLTELSAKWFTCDTNSVIPLVYSPEGEAYFKQKFISNLVYLNAMDTSRASINAQLMLECLRKNGFEPLDEKRLLDDLTAFFTDCRQTPSRRAYIGSGDVFENINLFCDRKGITQITTGAVEHHIVKEKLAGRKKLYFVMTTGSSFIDTYSKEFLQNQVAEGTSVYMILPNKYSDFCRDVAFIESPENSQENLKRMTQEFDSVVGKLKFVGEEAKKIAKDRDAAGHIFLCAAYNLLRQTICLGVSEDGGCWGWITTTMPPLRAAGNTPTIVFEGNLSDSGFFGNAVYRHIEQMTEAARRRNGFVDLTASPRFSSFEDDEVADLEERKEMENRWKEKYDRACEYMKKRQRLDQYVLIEIAAQHPLDGDRPGEEFRARLDYGYELFEKLKASGKNVSIYVPGSRHTCQGQPDPVSLSEAGCRYLKDRGVPPDCLFGDDANAEYMGKDGVYNSCDECFVSAHIFNDSGFGQLHCVCSPNQVVRKQLFYLNYKILPFIHAVPSASMYHSFTGELFESIPAILYKYPDWSSPDCPVFRASRQERMPGYREE